MSNIIWNDKLADEYVIFTLIQHKNLVFDTAEIMKGFDEFVRTREALKIPAPQPKEDNKEWEILILVYENVNRYREEDGLYRSHPEGNAYTVEELLDVGCSIVKIKRLLDGEAFSLGDEVGYLGSHFKIELFKIWNDTDMLACPNSGNFDATNIRVLYHYPKS